MTVTSGRQLWLLSSASGPLGSFTRMCLESSVWGNSTDAVRIWSRQVTPANRLLFRLQPSAHLTCGSASGLWRTPNAAMATGGGMDGQKRLDSGHALQLIDQVLTPKLWPTPHANCHKGPGDHGTGEPNLQTAIGGTLNPRWVEWLQGYPTDHTACAPSATRSCLR
jgi:hypothetical protein